MALLNALMQCLNVCSALLLLFIGWSRGASLFITPSPSAAGACACAGGYSPLRVAQLLWVGTAAHRLEHLPHLPTPSQDTGFESCTWPEGETPRAGESQWASDCEPGSLSTCECPHLSPRSSPKGRYFCLLNTKSKNPSFILEQKVGH